MDQSALFSLMVELFAAIRLLSAYPDPSVLPEIHALPQAEIQRRLCEGRSCRVKAYYHPDSGIVVDESLDLRGDDFDRSVLLHELVHHLQKTTGRYRKVASFCSRRISEEIEAYEIQNRYLSQMHSPRRALSMGWAGRCTDEVDAIKLPVASVGGGD